MAQEPEAVKVKENGHVAHEQSLSPTQRSWSMLRQAIGVFCLLEMALSAALFMLILAPPFILFLRPLSRSAYRQIVTFLLGLWLLQIPWLLEQVYGIRISVTGDDVPCDRRVLLSSNHRSEVDWMFLWAFALRRNRLGAVKFALKSSLLKLPVVSWAIHVFEWLALDRKWERDEGAIRSYCRRFSQPTDLLWLVFFPEGTDFRERKVARSHAFAREHNLPLFNRVLVPRTNGFCAAFLPLRTSLDALYDVTLAYNTEVPEIVDIVLGRKLTEVNFHVKRIPMAVAPDSDAAACKWLYQAFEEKEHLLEEFEKTQHFPGRAWSDRPLPFSSGLCIVLVCTLLCIYLIWLVVLNFRVGMLIILGNGAVLSLMTTIRWLPEPYEPGRSKTH